MSDFIESANTVSADVLARLWVVLWQWTVIALIGSAVILCLRRAQPAVRFWLWNLVLLKLALMPFWIVAVETTMPTEKPAGTVPVVKQGRDQAGTGMLAGSAEKRRPVRALTEDGLPSANTTQTAAVESRVRSASRIEWATGLVAVWGLLIAGQLFRTWRQHTGLRRFLCQTVPANAELVARVAQIASELGLRKPPRVVTMREECSPFVCGVRRAVLVLPASLWDSLTETSFRQVVLHELAHLKRRDLLWCWPAEFVRIVFWFHPLVHGICRRIHLERELACDQFAMIHSGGSPGSYAQTLVDVVTRGDDSRRSDGQSHSARLLTQYP